MGIFKHRFLAILLLVAYSERSKTVIDLRPIEPAFADAAEPGALAWACSGDPNRLKAFFQENGLPFVSTLVRRIEGQECHVYYRPSIKGFRASPEDNPVSELHASVNGIAFLAQRKQTVGDGLDILKLMLSAVPRPVNVTLAMSGGVPEAHYAKAFAGQFPGTSHHIRRHVIPDGEYDPWLQDVLKPGYAGSRSRILMTRNAYEGDLKMGADMQPMLSSLQNPGIVRSHLSWDGGDLQFIADPRKQGSLLLFYGTKAKRYWGTELSNEEFEYVLKNEFGADAAIYLRDVTPHVDYGVAMFPADRLALVVEPVCQNRELQRAALDTLLELYGTAAPPELTRIDRLWRASGADDREVRERIDEARQKATEWATPPDQRNIEDLEPWLSATCPDNPMACLRGASLASLLTQHPVALQAWIDRLSRTENERYLSSRMLDVIHDQYLACDEGMRSRLAANVADLQQLGFRVVRVPYVLAGDWAGLSYANGLLVDKTFFVPRFGLGRVEEMWLNQLANNLPPGYRVVPLYARAAMIANGGVHCVVAVVRQAAAPR